MTVEAGSRLGILSTRDDLYKPRLERGAIEAFVAADARPRLVQVETPATTCVNLGCFYRLEVNAAGSTIMSVTLGRVAFENGGRPAYVPAGARCRAEPGRGAGTPYWDDAPAAIVAAIDAYDAAPSAAGAASVIEAASRPRDTLSVWHLLLSDDAGVVAAARAALSAHVEPAETWEGWRRALTEFNERKGFYPPSRAAGWRIESR